MDELLDEDQKLLRESARRLCTDRGGAKRARALRDGGQDFDAEAWAAIGAAGWLGVLVPEAQGGTGLGAVELYVLLEQIGRAALMVPMIETAALSWALSSAKADAALTSLLAGDVIVPALAMDGWDFRGGKGEASAPFARTAEQFVVRIGDASLGLVGRNDPGVAVAVTRHVDGSSSGRVTFAGAPPALATGPEAEALAAGMADLLALGTAIELLGLAETALDLTLEHLKTRKQFGHPLGSFQALQHRVVDVFVDLETNRALLHRVCVAWDTGTLEPAMVAAAKSRSARAAADAMRTGLQLHGAIGYTDEHDIGILWKHSLVLAARYGNELTQSDRFARLTADET
jgi:alkylation response protein AidB-like acyl-CoA dehydrogenase